MGDIILGMIADKQIYEEAENIANHIIVEHLSSIMRAGETDCSREEFEKFMYDECAYILFCKMRDHEIDPDLLQETQNILGKILRDYFKYYHDLCEKRKRD